MAKYTIILEEVKRRTFTEDDFHMIANGSADTVSKWKSFSPQTQKSIFWYFRYLRGLVEYHDIDNYGSYKYWRSWFIRFVKGFDEANPKYDGNFEKVCLNNKPLADQEV